MSQLVSEQALQVKGYRADAEMCWSNWAALVSKPMLTAAQQWTKRELTTAGLHLAFFSHKNDGKNKLQPKS